MEFLGPILGLAGAAANAGWQGLAMQIQLQNMRNQQRNADRQYRFAGAARSDAYGNKQRYDDLLNEWITELTPTQKKITRAGEMEQLRSLTEDAARNRAIRVRAAERGKEAAKDYDRVLGEFRYNKPPSEDAIRGELQQLLAGVTESEARKGNTEALRQSIRSGKKAEVLPNMLRASDEDMGAALAGNLLKAKQGAMQEKQGRETAFAGKYLPLLNQLSQIMDQGGDMPLRFSNVPEQLMAMEGQQAQQILQALQSGDNLENSAFQSAAKTASAGGPDLRGIAGSLGGKGFGYSRSPRYNVAQPQTQQVDNLFNWKPDWSFLGSGDGLYQGSNLDIF